MLLTLLVAQLKSFSPLMGECALELVERLHAEAAAERTTQMLSLFHRTTFDVIGLAGFSTRFNSILGDKPVVRWWMYRAKPAKCGSLNPQ